MKTSQEVKEIIKKWYKELSFPEKYDNEFYEALETIYVDENAKSSEYDLFCTDGKKNLLHYLYFCEDLKQRYEEKGIPSDILYDTLHDVVIWTNTWSDLKGELYLGELDFLQVPFRMDLFKIGRLEFTKSQSWKNVPSKNIQKGTNVSGIHIPATGEPLAKDACIESIKRAKEFFKKFYPEFEYEHMVCYSWLLSDDLTRFFKPDSNIVRFGELFDLISVDERDSIISFIIGWKKTREDVKNMEFTSRVQNEIKQAVLNDERFHVGYGVIKDEYMK